MLELEEIAIEIALITIVAQPQIEDEEGVMDAG